MIMKILQMLKNIVRRYFYDTLNIGHQKTAVSFINETVGYFG